MKKQGFTILLILLISMISTKAMATDIAVKNADGVTIWSFPPFDRAWNNSEMNMK